MYSVFGAFILLFVAISTGCLIYLHLLPTGLHPLRNAVSEYGAGRFHFWYQAMCVNQAIAAFLTAAALATKVTPAPFATDAALIVLGLARLVISQAPVVVVHDKRTTSSRTHILMAVLIFGSAVVASMSFDRAIASHADWASVLSALRLFKQAIAFFALLTFLAVSVPRGLRYVGVVERLLYVSIIGWFVTIGIHLL
jgi:hypothetical protein